MSFTVIKPLPPCKPGGYALGELQFSSSFNSGASGAAPAAAWGFTIQRVCLQVPFSKLVIPHSQESEEHGIIIRPSYKEFCQALLPLLDRVGREVISLTLKLRSGTRNHKRVFLGVGDLQPATADNCKQSEEPRQSATLIYLMLSVWSVQHAAASFSETALFS